MTTHDPEGKTICIHSVCVDPSYQRQKLGSTLLEEYIRRWTDGPYDGISLVAHEELIKFYVAVGFKLVGKSEVVHGSKPWFELRFSLQPQTLDPSTQRRILDVLQEQSNQSEDHRLDKKLLSSFLGGPSELADEGGLNKLRLYCPRITCKSVILLASTAMLVERSSIMVTVYMLEPRATRNLTLNSSIVLKTFHPRIYFLTSLLHLSRYQRGRLGLRQTLWCLRISGSPRRYLSMDRRPTQTVHD